MRKIRFFNAVIMTAAVMAASLVMAACQLGTGSTRYIFTAFKGTSGNSYTNWTQVTDSSFTDYFKGVKLYGAAFGNGVYVVVGDGGQAAASKDGISNWAASNTGVTYYGSQVNACVFLQDGPNGTGHFYTFGEDSSGAPCIVSSPDGDVWTTVNQTAFTVPGAYIWDIAYGVINGTGTYVMICDGFSGSDYAGQKTAYSTDGGSTWSPGSFPFTGPAYQVEFADIFVLVGGDTGPGNGQTAYSNYGINWSGKYFGGTATQSRGLAYGITSATPGGLFVSAGRAGGDQLKYSESGVLWTTYTPANWSQYINAITYGDGLFLIGGGPNSSAGTGQARISGDPTSDTWTAIPSLQSIFYNAGGAWINAAAWGDVNNGRFIAAGDNGTAAYSTN